MDLRDKLMAALDKHEPDWWLRRASQQQLASYAYARNDVLREREKTNIRFAVASDLFVAVRAAIEAGIVELPTPVADDKL